MQDLGLQNAPSFTMKSSDIPETSVHSDIPKYAQEAKLTLRVFSPRSIPTQVIRPMKYNFTDEMIGTILDSSDPSDAVGYNAPNDTKAMVNGSILPGQGVPSSMTVMSSRWTFMMTLDRRMRDGATSRFIAAGYFQHEPVAPNTIWQTDPVMNKNAEIVFTSSTTVMIRETITPRGKRQDIAPYDNSGLANQEATHWANKELYKALPSAIRDATRVGFQSDNEYGGGGSLVDYSAMDLGYGPYSHRFPNSDNSPKHHLRKIVRAVDSGMMCVGGAGTTSFAGSLDQDSTRFNQGVDSVLAAGTDGQITASKFIDPTSRYTIAELEKKFPEMDVVIHKLDVDPQWDVRPQDDYTPQNVLSYMASNVISAVCSDLAIATVTFRYSSYQHQPDGTTGAWQFHDASLLTQSSDQQLQSTLMSFKIALENDLFPIIMTTAGNFDAMVRFDMVGQTLISLNLMEYGDNDGWFETAGILGANTSPCLNTEEGVVGNMNQLTRFIESAMDKSGASSVVDMYGNVMPDQADDTHLSFEPSHNYQPDFQPQYQPDPIQPQEQQGSQPQYQPQLQQQPAPRRRKENPRPREAQSSLMDLA